MKTLLTALLLFVTQHIIGQSSSVTLAWNANIETNVTGYRVYWGYASRAYFGTNNTVLVPNTSNVVSGLLWGSNYFFAATAYDDDNGLESDYSNEVTYKVPRINKPTGLRYLPLP